jgi:ATP-dependent DNA helicase 2 subunit 1
VLVTKTLGTGDGISLLQSLISSINSKATPLRSYLNSTLELGPDLKIGLKGYTMIRRQEPVKSCWVWAGGEHLQIATVASSTIEKETARKVEVTEIRHAYEFGGQLIEFSEEELSSIRNFDTPGMRIIGFKPLQLLPEWANCKHATFLYPDEANYVGSTRVFSALQQKLLISDKYALVWFQSRVNASPTLCAMIPGAEVLDEEGQQRTPAGLWLIQVPYADDIRRKPEHVKVRAPDNLVDKMKEIISQLRLPKSFYDPARYPNPSLQWFYRILQALALDEDIPDDPEDKTLPRYRQIHKRAGKLIMEWAETLSASFKQYSESNPNAFFSGGLPKRPAVGDSDRPAKKLKESKDIDDDDMKNYYEKNTVSKLTIADLSAWLKSHKITTSGKKADYVAAVETYFSKR